MSAIIVDEMFCVDLMKDASGNYKIEFISAQYEGGSFFALEIFHTLRSPSKVKGTAARVL